MDSYETSGVGIQNPMELEAEEDEEEQGSDGNWQCYECKRFFVNRKALYR